MRVMKQEKNVLWHELLTEYVKGEDSREGVHVLEIIQTIFQTKCYQDYENAMTKIPYTIVSHTYPYPPGSDYMPIS